MATRKTAAAKVAATVSPEPVDQADGGAVDDVTVITTDEPDDVPAGAGAPSGGVGPVGGGAPASGRAGGASAAGTPQGYAAWVVPAPAPLATAAVGSAGYYVGIRQGVEDRAAPFAAWLGTDAPKASWPA